MIQKIRFSSHKVYHELINCFFSTDFYSALTFLLRRRKTEDLSEFRLSPCTGTVPCRRTRRHRPGSTSCRQSCSRKDGISDSRSNPWCISRTWARRSRFCKGTDPGGRTGTAWRPGCRRTACIRCSAPGPTHQVCIGRSARRRSSADTRSDRCRGHTRDRVAHTNRTLWDQS